MMRLRSILFAALSLCVAGPAGAQQRSTMDGVFNREQAERGREVWLNVCANCHTRGQFTDGTFRRNWQGRTVFDVFERLRTTMPDDNPGGLSRQEYVDVLSYLLQVNGYPTGEQEMRSSDAVLRRVRFDPLPDSGGALLPHR